MESFTLTRTGLAPLKFQGELLAEADGERQAGRERNRWHELAVYRTAGGKYVLKISYRTKWQGELDHDHAESMEKASGVELALRNYDPAKHVGGYPQHAAYAERQAKLLADIRQSYAALVSEVLASDSAFAEVVE